MKVFGERLKELRKTHKMKQEDLGNVFAYPVTKQTISNYEAGTSEPDFKGLLALAKHFDVTPQYLLGYSDFANPQHEELSQKNILSDEAIKGLLSYSPDALKILDILFCTHRFAFLLSAYNSYYNGIAYPKLLNAGGFIGSATNIPIDSDEKSLERQIMQFSINYVSEMILNDLDVLRKEKESGK